MKRALLVLFACLVCSTALSASSPRQATVIDVLNLYDRGEFDTALDVLRGFAVGDDDFFKTFDREATRWVEQRVDETHRRPFVSATVALEIARLLRDKPDYYAGRFLLWASNLVRKWVTGPPSETERLWHLACLAAMQSLDQTWALTSGLAENSPLALIGNQPRGGQLAVASARFPEEPRFLFTQTLQAVRLSAADDGFEPAALEAVEHAAKRYDPATYRPNAGIDVDVAYASAGDLAARTRIPESIRKLEALNVHPVLRAEIELRIGYLEGGRQNWPAAFARLRRVPELTDDVDLRFLSYYLAGRILIATKRRDDAIRALESALRVVPRARSASTLLAVQLFLTDNAANRDRAHALLREAYTPPLAVDPWRWFFFGDARLWPTYIVALRKSLR